MINQDSDKQAASTSKVSQSLIQLDQLTQSNSASAEQISASSTVLVEQTSKLQELVKQIQKNIGGSKNDDAQDFQARKNMKDMENTPSFPLPSLMPNDSNSNKFEF